MVKIPSPYSERQELLSTLLNAFIMQQGYPFKELLQARHQTMDPLRELAGVYNFYQVEDNGDRTSLFVGSAAFEIPTADKSRTWGLHARLSQHFHPSQKNTIAGRMAKAQGTTPRIIIRDVLCKKKIFLQWFPTFGMHTDGGYLRLKDQKHITDHAQMAEEIKWCEYFAIAILQPLYAT